MDYEEIRQLTEEINEQLYYHEEATTSEKQVEALERLEQLANELQDLIK